MTRGTFISSIFALFGGTALFGGIFIGHKIPLGPYKDFNGVGSESDPFSDKLAHGPLDNMNTPRLWCRQQVAEALKRAFPGYSTCERCDWPWSLIQERTVYYSGDAGSFALCRDCWDELQVAELRIPYHRKLAEEQHAQWLKYKDKYPGSPDPLGSQWEALKAQIIVDSES